MQETTVPISTLLAYSLWVTTAVLVLVAWGVYPVDHDLAIMIATCGSIAGLGAGTATVRCYAVRLARLIRLAGGIQRSDSERLHSVHE